MAKSMEMGPKPEQELGEKDLVASAFGDIQEHIKELESRREDVKDPQILNRLEEAIAGARIKADLFALQMAGAFDQLAAEGKIPEEARKQTLDQIADIEQGLMAAENLLYENEGDNEKKQAA